MIMTMFRKLSLPIAVWLLLAIATVEGAPQKTNRTSMTRMRVQKSSPEPLQLSVSGSEDKPESVKLTDGAKPVLEMSGEANSSTPMDPAVMKVLSRVLETLESIRDARSKELNEASRELDTLASTQKESSSGPLGLADTELNRKKKPIIKKTYGYKVTVYATPLNGTKEGDNSDDLQAAGSHPDGVIHAYGTPVVAYPHGATRGATLSKGSGGGHQQGRKDVEDRGYARGEKKKAENVDHHENDRYYHKQGGHLRDAADTGHNRGEFGHDRGAANEKGLKEKTQIEYFEREAGQQEEEVKDAGKAVEGHHGQSANQAAGGQGGGQYYYNHGVPQGHGVHYVQTPYVNGQQAHGQQSGGGGHRADAHDVRKRRKNEGLKERGFKITVEREVYLRDGFHDKGFGKHDQGHHKELRERGHHKVNQGDTHKHLTKELKEHEGYDKGYGLKKHEIADAEEGGSHLSAGEQGGHLAGKGGVSYVEGDADHHYSPSNEDELGVASVVKNDTLIPEEAQAKREEPGKTPRARRPVALSPPDRPQRPRRPDVPPLQKTEEAPQTRPRQRRPLPPRPDEQNVGDDEIPPSSPLPYLPRNRPNLRAPRVRGQPPPQRNPAQAVPNSFLDSITPPTGEAERFAFNVPQKEAAPGGHAVHFPANQGTRNGPLSVQPVPVINLYVPENQEHKQTHYDLQAYPQSNEVPLPENPDLELIRRHRVFVPKQLGTYQKLGFSQQLSPSDDSVQINPNHVPPGVWYAPDVEGKKK